MHGRRDTETDGERLQEKSPAGAPFGRLWRVASVPGLSFGAPAPNGAVRALGLAVVLATGCASAPSPLWPHWHGSIGLPGRGVLAEGQQVRANAPGLRWLRDNDRHWAISRFSGAIERAAALVSDQRPGAVLAVGDLSTRTGGGPLLPHFSHRSGLDADLLFYVSTLDSAPVDSPGFIHFGADGLARDEAHGRWLRFDVEREWLLVKALVEDREARVQWIFVSEVIKALLTEWALARGESTETLYRAQAVMAQPTHGGVHDDHIHVRTSCSADEIIAGCEPYGPERSWLANDVAPLNEPSENLALTLLVPLESQELSLSDAILAPWPP
jgi:penicillin-insensitive murein endopeptidase